MLWYSEGKKKHISISEMSHHHAKAALAKLNRSDYLDEFGREVEAGHRDMLSRELEARVNETEPKPE